MHALMRLLTRILNIEPFFHYGSVFEFTFGALDYIVKTQQCIAVTACNKKTLAFKKFCKHRLL